MASILAFAGSNSSISINFKLLKYTSSFVVKHEILVLNMADFSLPMYSEDEERDNGFSEHLIGLKENIQKASGLIISVNEHNSNPSAYFKNLIDWLSRLDKNLLEGKKVLLMSTSPGKRGAIGAHEVAGKMMTRFGAEIVATFSLPSFQMNFDEENGIIDAELSKSHQTAITDFMATI
jgi:NAD(P)H-dependent FMN reductase